MFDELETLRLLLREGTMTGVATRLRITQSAVSKRIQALESRVGKRLVLPDGRRVKLSPAALRLLERTEPLLAELRTALQEEVSEGEGTIRLAVSESVLASWGARALKKVLKAHPGIDLQLHAHRSLGVLDRVRSGECMVGLCAGGALDAPELAVQLLGEEPFVLVPSALDTDSLSLHGKIDVMTIEPGSATWASLGPRLKRAQTRWPFRLEVSRTLQSFSCLVELARAGHGHALVPSAVARAVGVPASACIALPAPGLFRQVSLVARPSMLGQPLVQTFALALAKAAAQVLVVPSSKSEL